MKGSRMSQPFHEELETSICIFISTTVLHLDLLCYALSSAGTSTATSHWSGAFNLFEFDHAPKKERKPAKWLNYGNY